MSDDLEEADIQALADLAEMRLEMAQERLALMQQVRADLLAGRLSRPAAIERIGLMSWTALCTTLSDDELQRVLGGDA